MLASDRAYATIRDEIVEWKLLPGTVLGEVEQSTRLGVSRTPVREALARLTADGLVEAQAGRGLVVSEASADSVIELFELREALEERAAALVAVRRDPAVFEELQREFRQATNLIAEPGRHAYYDLVRRFDEALDDAVGNSYLVASLRSLRTHLVRIRRVAQDNPDRLIAAAAEHLLIIDAIVDGDPELAKNATHIHLYRSLRNILDSAEAGRFVPAKSA